MYIRRVEAAIAELRAGKMIILTDHPDRENEGDLIFPAEIISENEMNFMIRNGSGIVCLSLTASQLKKLSLPFMVAQSENTSQRGTPFTVSIEARDGVTTGVSAKDRATTVLTAIKPDVKPDDLVKPGHIFPLQAKAGGVLERQGHTEGAIDIVSLAGFHPSAVLCEIMNPDGSMTRGEQLNEFAQQHNLAILSIDDIIAYRLSQENLIADSAEAHLPTKYGDFTITVIKEKFQDKQHIILEKKPSSQQPLLVRIHSACSTGDIFGSKRCDCNLQLDHAMQRISEEGGLLIYLAQEGRGVGLFNKIKAYALQESGLDTVTANHVLGLSADSRDYYLAANILRNKKVTHVKLLTNNPHKIENLQKYGLQYVEREAMPTFRNEHNKNYLQAKKEKLNHLME